MLHCGYAPHARWRGASDIQIRTTFTLDLLTFVSLIYFDSFLNRICSGQVARSRLHRDTCSEKRSAKTEGHQDSGQEWQPTWSKEQGVPLPSSKLGSEWQFRGVNRVSTLVTRRLTDRLALVPSPVFRGLRLERTVRTITRRGTVLRRTCLQVSIVVLQNKINSLGCYIHNLGPWINKAKRNRAHKSYGSDLLGSGLRASVMFEWKMQWDWIMFQGVFCPFSEKNCYNPGNNFIVMCGRAKLQFGKDSLGFLLSYFFQ